MLSQVNKDPRCLTAKLPGKRATKSCAKPTCGCTGTLSPALRLASWCPPGCSRPTSLRRICATSSSTDLGYHSRRQVQLVFSRCPYSFQVQPQSCTPIAKLLSKRPDFFEIDIRGGVVRAWDHSRLDGVQRDTSSPRYVVCKCPQNGGHQL